MRIFQPSDIAGGVRRLAPTELLRIARRLSASLTARLLVLVVIFVALPIILYGQFESVDRETRQLVVRSIQNRSWLIAQALKPILDRSEGPPHESLNAELHKYSDDGTILKLMLQPSSKQGPQSFYYVASAPQEGADQLDAELDSLRQHDILQSLSRTCTLDKSVEIRYGKPGQSEEVLTSVIPIRTRWGCWALISSHGTAQFLDTSIGRPYWQTREVRLAAFIYLIAVLLAVLVALSVWRNVRHFRSVAREIRQGEVGERSFVARNVIPELASVAADFDRFVLDLHGVARDIRQAAEDNAHSFKAPVATIQASLDSLRRLATGESERVKRALTLIDSSLDRLKALISAAQRLDNNTADLIEAPRLRVNLTQLVADALLRCREIMAECRIHLTRQLDEDVIVYAGRGVLDVVIENILDNAISFSPQDGVITVTLTKGRQAIDLVIEDEGPGIDSSKISRIFDRYFSLRPRNRDDDGMNDEKSVAEHSGLGLWIVRRNVEVLGGRVTATNRVGGGLSVRVTLPVNE